MTNYQSEYLRGKTLEQLIEDLGTVAQPGSVVHEMVMSAIQAKMVERLATPRRWAWVASIAAVVSALHPCRGMARWHGSALRGAGCRGTSLRS